MVSEPTTCTLLQGKKLGAMMARQMATTAAAAAAAADPRNAQPPKQSVAEKVRQNIIDQYRQKRQRMPQLPSVRWLAPSPQEESGAGGLTREVETRLPSNSPHDHMILRGDLVGSHGRWKRPCLETAHMTI
jgi:hypothetical protein